MNGSTALAMAPSVVSAMPRATNRLVPSGGVRKPISQFITSTNGFETYTGSTNLTNFALAPGTGYSIQLAAGITITPAHY